MKQYLPKLLIALMFLLPSSSWGAMTIRDYSAAEHYRFYSGSDKDFIGESYDFSGVGLSNKGKWATLISDNYFISAKHAKAGVNQTVTFWATNDLTGPSYSYTVAGGIRIGQTDLWIGWFDESVDASIERYSVSTLLSTDDYIGLELYNYGKTHRVGKNVLEYLTTYSYGSTSATTALYDFDNNDTPSVGGDETVLQVGDSGAPSFALVDSSLSLVGIHWLSDRSSLSVDTFVPTYFDDINTVLGLTGQSLNSMLTPVPEPGMFWYLVITSGYLWLRRRRSISA